MRSVWRLCFSLRLERWGPFAHGGLRRHTLLLRPPKIHDFEFDLAPFIRMTIAVFTRTQMRGRQGLIIAKLCVNKGKILIWSAQYGKKFCSEQGCHELQRTCWSLFSIVAKQRVKWSLLQVSAVQQCDKFLLCHLQNGSTELFTEHSNSVRCWASSFVTENSTNTCIARKNLNIGRVKIWISGGKQWGKKGEISQAAFVYGTHGKLLFLRFLEISIRSRFAHVKTVYSKYTVDI